MSELEVSSNRVSQWDKHMVIQHVSENGVDWYDPACAPFRVGGLAWFSQDHKYRRLPEDPALPEAVRNLSYHTAGGTIAFRSDCRRLLVRVEFTSPFHAMWHYAPTGASGIDLYEGGPGHWRTVGVSRLEEGVPGGTAELYHNDGPRAWREYLLNLPLYNGIRSIQIGLDEGAAVDVPTPWASPKRIVIYGGSTVQGACVSRPGRAYMNILARHFNLDMVNLGFSGSSRLEPIVAQYTARVPDPGVIFVEGDRNAGVERVRDLEPGFIRILRAAHPGVPIVVLQGNKVWENDGLSLSEASRKEIMAAQQEFMVEMQKGDPDLYWWNCEGFLGEDDTEGTVDGCHPNDLGAYRIAENMISRLTKIFRDNSHTSSYQP